MMRLRALHHLSDPDLFHSEQELLEVALAKQESRIAYVDETQVRQEQE